MRYSLIVVLVGAAAGAWAQLDDDQKAVGWVEEWHGEAKWRANHSSPAEPLRWPVDRYKKLHPHEAVFCMPGCTMQLQLYGIPVAVTAASGWYPIPRAGPGSGDEDKDLRRGGRYALERKALDFYDRQSDAAPGSAASTGGGGAEPAAAGAAPDSHLQSQTSASSVPALQILAPADQSTVSPQRLVIRFVNSSTVRLLIISISNMRGRELWRESGPFKQEEQFAPGGARRALEAYRASGATDRLTLRIAGQGLQPASISFELLTVRDEISLKTELKECDGSLIGLMRQLCRASSFDQYKMLTEAADEMEVALGQAPQSRELLEATIQAESLAGNWRREGQLEDRLISSWPSK
jgi:hypothetical protein